MPLITVTLLKGRTPEEKQKIGDAIYASLIAIGVPEADRFQRFIELDSENFLYDKHYPNLTAGRSHQFLIIEILFSVGRSVKIKRQVLELLIGKLKDLSIAPHDVFVSFQETAWENWSFANGEIIHA